MTKRLYKPQPHPADIDRGLVWDVSDAGMDRIKRRRLIAIIQFGATILRRQRNLHRVVAFRVISVLYRVRKQLFDDKHKTHNQNFWQPRFSRPVLCLNAGIPAGGVGRGKGPGYRVFQGHMLRGAKERNHFMRLIITVLGKRATGWMGGAVLTVLFGLTGAIEAHAADSIGLVKTSKGSVTIERTGQKIAAPSGTILYSSDQVLTGADAAVGMTFIDNSRLSLGANSVLALEKFRFNTTTHEGEFVSSVKRGTLAAVSGKIAKQTPEAMQVRTPSAILGVRGTKFVVEVPE